MTKRMTAADSPVLLHLKRRRAPGAAFTVHTMFGAIEATGYVEHPGDVIEFLTDEGSVITTVGRVLAVTIREA